MRRILALTSYHYKTQMEIRLIIRGSFKMFWNHFISERYKTVQLFKPYFLQTIPLVKL